MTALLLFGQYVSRALRDENNQPVDRPALDMAPGVAAMVGVLTIVLGIPAAYLSYTSNALVEWNGFWRAAFAVVAFFFCAEYLLVHALFKADAMRELRRLKNGNAGWFWKGL